MSKQAVNNKRQRLDAGELKEQLACRGAEALAITEGTVHRKAASTRSNIGVGASPSSSESSLRLQQQLLEMQLWTAGPSGLFQGRAPGHPLASFPAIRDQSAGLFSSDPLAALIRQKSLVQHQLSGNIFTSAIAERAFLASRLSSLGQATPPATTGVQGNFTLLDSVLRTTAHTDLPSSVAALFASEARKRKFDESGTSGPGSGPAPAPAVVRGSPHFQVQPPSAGLSASVGNMVQSNGTGLQLMAKFRKSALSRQLLHTARKGVISQHATPFSTLENDVGRPSKKHFSCAPPLPSSCANNRLPQPRESRQGVAELSEQREKSNLPSKSSLPGMTGRSPVAMYTKFDDRELSEYQVLVRKQVELFEADEQHAHTNARGRNKQLVVGQVGIRCRHCNTVPPHLRQRAAQYYPAKLDRIYQACSTLAQVHLCEKCEHVPSHIREELCRLRDEKLSAHAGKNYWAQCASGLGVHETNEDGLRFEQNPSNKDEKTGSTKKVQ